MTVLDDRADAIADQLRNASIVTARIADARDEARPEPPGIAQGRKREHGMPERGQSVQTTSRAPILTGTEADNRRLLLAELQRALSALGVDSVLARNHRLVLRYNLAPYEPSGPTDPQLHVFAPHGQCAVTTDEAVYRLPGGRECPVADPGAAAAAIMTVTAEGRGT
jgi:hypothetical protein